MRRYPTRNAALFHTLRRLVASLCCVFLFVQGVRYGRYHFFALTQAGSACRRAQCWSSAWIPATIRSP